MAWAGCWQQRCRGRMGLGCCVEVKRRDLWPDRLGGEGKASSAPPLPGLVSVPGCGGPGALSWERSTARLQLLGSQSTGCFWRGHEPALLQLFKLMNWGYKHSGWKSFQMCSGTHERVQGRVSGGDGVCRRRALSRCR